MTELQGTPTNINELLAGNFTAKLSVDKLPTTAFFLQGWTLPNFSVQPIMRAGLNKRLPEAGTVLSGPPVSFAFKVDEDMRNWFEIYMWLQGLAFPIGFEQFREWSRSPEGSYELTTRTKSSLSFQILKNNKEPNINIRFENAFPVSLSSVIFDASNAQSTVTATAEFEFTHMTFKYVD